MINEERNVSVDSASETLRYNVKPRSNCEKPELLRLYVYELKSYEAYDEQSLNREKCQVEEDCQFALLKPRIVI